MDCSQSSNLCACLCHRQGCCDGTPEARERIHQGQGILFLIQQAVLQPLTKLRDLSAMEKPCRFFAFCRALWAFYTQYRAHLAKLGACAAAQSLDACFTSSSSWSPIASLRCLHASFQIHISAIVTSGLPRAFYVHFIWP